MATFEMGSTTAKGGFANERTICDKFNNWKNDKEAQIWLKIMGYDIEKIDFVKSIQIPIRIRRDDIEKFGMGKENYEKLMQFKKADVQIRIMIRIGSILSVENISLKKANSNANYNQVDKRWIDTYKEMWGFDEEIVLGLKLFTGELNHKSYPNLIGKRKLRDKRRIFLNEVPENIRNKIINFFEDNKIAVVSDILMGRGGLSADWMLVTRYNKQDQTTTWILKDINTAMNFFGKGTVRISPRGSLYIGKITMQRKGGTPDPTKLQFKIKPCDLFKLGAENGS
jgi:hypothetical protein